MVREEVGRRSNSGRPQMADSGREKLGRGWWSTGKGAGGGGASPGGRNRRMAARAGWGADGDAPARFKPSRKVCFWMKGRGKGLIWRVMIWRFCWFTPPLRSSLFFYRFSKTLNLARIIPKLLEFLLSPGLVQFLGKQFRILWVPVYYSINCSLKPFTK
jgi:hypothetical protein